MGLDINAYSGLRKVEGEPVRDEGDFRDEVGTVSFSNLPWHHHGKELEEGVDYQYDDVSHIWSGGYGSYSRWREELAKLAGYLPTEGAQLPHSQTAWESREVKPFYMLINFTDCDGFIGPVVAKRLLKDFEDFEQRAKDEMTEDDFEVYCAIKGGLMMAADNGALVFC